MEDANSLSSCLQPETNSIATGRQAAKISSSMLIHEIFSSPAVASKLSSIVGEELTAATDFPMELRVYRVGASMPWHSDDVIYTTPQVEAIYTVSNDSDSLTQWQLPSGGGVASERLEPNSLLLVRAGGPQHQVTPARRGSRTIVKAVFATGFEHTGDFGRLFRASPVARKAPRGRR